LGISASAWDTLPMKAFTLAPCLALCALLGGCYLSHAREARPDGGALADAGDSGVDARIMPDATTPLDGGSCSRGGGVVVRVEAITADVARCAVSHAEGVQVLGVERAPADDGIRIHADLCPGMDADCRCDVVIANVGVDLADLVLMPSAGNTLDLAPNYVSIAQTPTCECLGCPCGMELVFEAADALIEPSPHPSTELVFSAGALVCPEPAACVSATWALHAASMGVESDVPAGEQRDLGIVHVRSVRDVDIFGPCAACATCGSRRASWVAWVRH
jgi:hypothetical protein